LALSFIATMDVGESSEPAAPKPWQIARVEAVERILSDSTRRIGRMLDVGVADGYTGERLCKRLATSFYVAYDARSSDAECAKRSHAGLRFVNVLPPAARDFDLVLVRDALEHTADDGALLREVRARVHTRGRVLVFVPAFEALFSDYDRNLGRYRRYSLEALCETMNSLGLPVKSSGYLFGSVLAPRALRRASDVVKALLPGKRERSGERRAAALQNSVVHRLATSALSVESSAILSLNARGMRVPGITAWLLSDLFEAR
jgi:hypothetical protein